jgi:hypothetical protein
VPEPVVCSSPRNPGKEKVALVDEADEPLIGLGAEEVTRIARENLLEKWRQYRAGEESLGVVWMYERAALNAGMTLSECEDLIPPGPVQPSPG